MNAAEIISQLTHAEGLPKLALQAASEQRAEMLPAFLHEIASFLALAPVERAKPTPLFFIFHLLGQWREKPPYRPLAGLLRCPHHEVDAILGGAITSTTHRVMAAIFDGDPDPLYEIILDPNADQFVRSRMCEAVAMLVLRGELDPEKCGGVPSRRLHGTTTASAILCLARMAERYCDARLERTENLGQTGLRSRFHRSAMARLRRFCPGSR